METQDAMVTPPRAESSSSNLLAVRAPAREADFADAPLQTELTDIFAFPPNPADMPPDPADLFPHLFPTDPLPVEMTRHDWPLNVPPPDLLLHLVDTFFACAPFASHIVHQPTFMANLLKPAASPDFPHVALLHAICAMASLYTPVIVEVPADPETNKGTTFFHTGIQKVPQPMPRYLPKTVEDILGDEDTGFGATQMRWCTMAVNAAARDGDRLLQLLQGGW